MWVLRISFGVGQQRQSLTAWTSACGSKLDYPDVIGARDGARLHLEGSPKLLEDFGFYGRSICPPSKVCGHEGGRRIRALRPVADGRMDEYGRRPYAAPQQDRG